MTSARRFRIGVFGREGSPTDGGADTLLGTIGAAVARLAPGGSVEFVPVPENEWSHRHRPLRRVWTRMARSFGNELPLVDLRPLCRHWRLDAAYFAAPVFARIDVPFVFTLWDLGHRTIPEFPEVRAARDSWTYREALCRRMLPQASFVVVGNEAGATEARELFGLSPERVVAIPFPTPDFSDVVATIPTGLPAAPFFLYPAQCWPHKNHFTLIQALAQMARSGRPVPGLVFTGADKGNAAYLKAVAASAGVAEHVQFRGFVSRGELKALYQRAVALVFPSLLGPNNLPPQEATVLGCPAIVSDLPGHRQQLGAGALYVPPLDAAAWSEAMLQVVNDAEFRAALVVRAREAAAGCTVEAYATRLGELFSRVIATRMLWGG
jgi:glycosyltransferase involved in cell wall biosynthesis